ncbi:hypothetical protein SAMN04489844_0901 [Nocardioides exalbidus]|uniref:Uncharacterized protein n=1 Tax=Nocardioides exalbidus TaxID=402596 RepID=A0A1H4LKW6_9ACTN|nr:hypothetical protein [Nocardioides exalbidus]SEB71281.1 hypothetical protein SAMN04489844_0901 [Nocardioides exalbidus]
MPRRAVLALVAVLVVVVGGLVVWRSSQSTTALSHALELAPAGTSRSSWTDWEGVRREVGAEVDASSSADDVDAFVADAFGADLTSMSALGTSAGTMQEELGLSPATISWELLAQSGDGAVELMGVGDDVDLDDVADRLDGLGWTRPDDDDDVWVGGTTVLASVGALTPELQHFALLRDRGIVMASDQAAFLEQAVEVAKGDADGAGDLAGLAAGLEDPVAAAVYSGDYACEHLAMAQADDDAQAEADQLVAAAGGVHPLTGFAMGLLPDGDVRALLQVEDSDDAPDDADARAGLASGPAPGQGGDFADRFSLEDASAEGRVVTLDLRPREGEYVLSDLTSGPVLFATC